jgi:midasin
VKVIILVLSFTFISGFEFQETALCFINRLTYEYAAYNDIIQPIQVAVYEMKFGLSLVLSSTLEKEYLRKVGHENINLIMVTLSFIEYFHV